MKTVFIIWEQAFGTEILCKDVNSIWATREAAENEIKRLEETEDERPLLLAFWIQEREIRG